MGASLAESEGFLDKELIEYMMDNDGIAHMPPVELRTVKAGKVRIVEAKPHLVEPAFK